jgi:biotin carboxylase
MDIAQALFARLCLFGEVIAEKFVGSDRHEGLMHEGVFHCTGFADRNYARLDDTVPFMVEDGGDIPTILNGRDKKLVEAEFEKAARGLGIDWGPAKGDMIFGDDGKAYVIEIAARLSGGNFCYDKVPWSTGVDIVDILVDMAVGNDVDPRALCPPGSATSQRYFFPRRDHQRSGIKTGSHAAYPQSRCLGHPGELSRPGKPSLPGNVILSPNRDQRSAASRRRFRWRGR